MTSTKLVRKVLGVAHHRNGIGGESFYVVRFIARDDEGHDRRMVATVFHEPGYVSVLDYDAVADGEIGFGINSWRGDEFERELREATTAFEAERAAV